MDLGNLSDMMGEEQVVGTDTAKEYVVLRTPKGEVSFTFGGDDRLETAFKDWEQIMTVEKEKYFELLAMRDNCSWDKKLDYVNEEFVIVDKYSEEEKNAIMSELKTAEDKSFYEHEKRLALAIEEDYRLGLEDITDEQMKEVKVYIKAIHPTPATTLSVGKVERPQIIIDYEEKEKAGLI